MAQGYVTEITKKYTGVQLILTLEEAKDLINLLPEDYRYGPTLRALQEGYEDARRESMT